MSYNDFEFAVFKNAVHGLRSLLGNEINDLCIQINKRYGRFSTDINLYFNLFSYRLPIRNKKINDSVKRRQINDESIIYLSVSQ